MVRTPDPKVAAKREEAAELEREGKSIREIAKTMGARAGTVKKWLQIARGPKKKAPYKSRVIEMLKDGESFEAIVEKVKCTHENVRKIEREIRSTLTKDYSWRESRIKRYIADPETEIQKRYARSESFGRDLVAQVNRATVLDPMNAKSILDVGVNHFTTLKGRLRSPEKIKIATCNLVQVKAAVAARERVLERPKAGLSLLQQLTEEVSCVSCCADLARRESIILHDLDDFDRSLSRVEHAEALYRQMGHNGHDGYGNGLASCALAKVGVLHYTRRFVESERTSSAAFHTLPGGSHGDLRFGLRYNQALSMVELPGRAEEAKTIALILGGEFGDTSSVPRLFTMRLFGYASEKLGHVESALSAYRDAFEDADSLEIPAAIGALGSDIGRLVGNPIELQERINRLLECDWLSSISSVLLRTMRISETDFAQALNLLRMESGGDQMFPIFSIPHA